jgi:hypothetical protein
MSTTMIRQGDVVIRLSKGAQALCSLSLVLEGGVSDRVKPMVVKEAGAFARETVARTGGTIHWLDEMGDLVGDESQR